MTQNQDETYFHDLGHEGACTAFYRGCFGNLFGGTRTPMFDGFSRVLMDLICFDGLQFHKWFLMVSEQLKTCIAHSQSLRNTCETQLSGKGREPKFMFPKKNLLTCFLI